MAAKTPDYKLRVAYVKDVQSSGVSQPATPSTSYATYPLNTVEGDSEIVSLLSNEFTLEPGKYDISTTLNVGFPTVGTAPAVKAKIRNITDASDAIIGLTTFIARGPDTGDGWANTLKVEGSIELTESKTFALQWRAAAVGILQYGPTSFGDSEVYAIIKITKREY